MKRILLILCVSALGLSSISAQTDADKFTPIFLEFNHSLRIPNGLVQIQIYNRPNGVELRAYSQPLKDTQEWAHTRVQRTLSISKEVFQKWYQQAQTFNQIDLEQAMIMGKDGATCSIEFGGFGGTVTYKFWSPNYDTKPRGLTSFLSLFEEILTAAGFDPKEIL
jgi:hypothetical protein